MRRRSLCSPQRAVVVASLGAVMPSHKKNPPHHFHSGSSDLPRSTPTAHLVPVLRPRVLRGLPALPGVPLLLLAPRHQRELSHSADQYLDGVGRGKRIVLPPVHEPRRGRRHSGAQRGQPVCRHAEQHPNGLPRPIRKRRRVAPPRPGDSFCPVQKDSRRGHVPVSTPQTRLQRVQQHRHTSCCDGIDDATARQGVARRLKAKIGSGVQGQCLVSAPAAHAHPDVLARGVIRGPRAPRPPACVTQRLAPRDETVRHHNVVPKSGGGVTDGH
eukprot:scaffold6361_cov132-Isochrysis_galbana.AAC.8